MNPAAPPITDAAIRPDSNRPPTATYENHNGGSSPMPRRAFLRRIGVGAVTAAVLTDVALAYRAYDQGVLAEERGPAFDAWTSWGDGTDSMSLVAAAVLAASAHNTQPWRFAVSEDQIDLYADLQRTTGANDALNREFDVSLGCALENLALAARASGRVPEIEVLPGGVPELAASVRLSSGPAVEDELYRAIGDRHSNRSEYRSDPVPNSALEDMGTLADDSAAPAQLVWLTSTGDRQQFGDLLVEATRAHVADDEQSRASFVWWRSDWDEIQQRKDGLTIDGVGLSPLVRTIGKLLPGPSRAAADRTFIERTELQARSAAAFGLIVVDDPTSRADRLAGGRLVQRLHLWCTAHDLAFQHMNQITERIDRNRQLGQPAAFEAPLADLVGDGALVAFRIGTPTVASLRSPRRPAPEVLR